MTSLTVDITFAAASLVLIIIGCELFTNSVEWFGSKCNLSTGACGSVLAAVGTALPETLVPIVAFVRGGADARAIGTGGILGAPFMLATLAFTVTAIGVLGFARSGRRGTSDMLVDADVLRHDLGYFIVAYAVAVAASFLHVQVAKYAIAAALVVFYGYYVWVHLSDESCIRDECEIAPLRITPGVPVPRLRFVVAQIAIGLGFIFVGAHIFVGHLETIAAHLGTSALVLSIIITPIATELPEKFNSVLWVRDSKDTLAMGNITGAMVFQSTIPVTIGILATPWALDKAGLASAAIALTSSLLVYAYMRTRGKLSPWALLVGLPLYVVFLLIAF